MVEMIIMLMTRMSPARLEARRRRLTEELKKDGKFRHPADAAQWGNINNHFLWFDEDVRSIQFL
jgi:hypothetical protein